MDFFANLIANKTSTAETIRIRKLYLNEDPNTENTEPCPVCMAQSHQSNVRYMYVNMQEAIYKCESPTCMYPFQNFKFKNYTDNTVYYYTLAKDATPPAFEDLRSTFPNAPFLFQVSHEEHEALKANSSMEFNLDLHSPERCRTESKFADVSPGENIFDSPSLSYKNLIQDFDTGFIDDILQDLKQPSPEKKPVPKSLGCTVQKGTSTASRQLKRCLQMLEDNSGTADTVFKIPPLPGSEVPGSPKNKSKKHSPMRRHNYVRRTNHSSSSADKLSKKCQMKPLDFIENMNFLHPKEAPLVESRLTGVKPLKNKKVERMLNFIERSMKKREPTPEATVEHMQAPKHSAKQAIKKHRPYIKPKRLSLSAAVLQDSQFDYSTSGSEQEDTSDTILPSPVRSDNCNLVSRSQLPLENDPNHSLPLFEDPLMQINPVQSKVSCHNISEAGFRSAGSSPTRVQQYEETPPRRIHSMESLNSLLE